MVTTTTGLATSFITFSRPGASGGGATVTDRDGKIKWAGHNLLLASESFDSSSWVRTGLSSVAANSIAAPNGTLTADKIVENSSASTHRVDQTTAAPVAGASYTVTVYCKPAGRNFAMMQIVMGGVNSYAICDLTTATFGTPTNASGSATFNAAAIGDGWVRMTGVFTASDTTTEGVKFFTASNATTFNYTGDGSSGIYAWGAHLYRSDLGGMQANPAMPASMASYYPTSVANRLGFTEDFSNAAWGKTNIAAFGSGSVANSIVAPNGLQTADKIVANTSADTWHVITQGLAFGSAPHVLSVYAKAGEYSKLRVSDYSNGVFYASFDLASGTVISGATGGTKFVSASIISVGSGWYRCAVVVSGVTTTPSCAFSGYPDGAVLDNFGAKYTGDGTSGIYLWGAQLSDSASLDTYVPVYGAAVTSAAYYAPRLDFDGATLSPKGLLVEEARTNLLSYSADFANIYWAKSGSTISADAVASPGGDLTADKLVEAGTDAQHRIAKTIGVTSGVAYTFSVYVKAGERTAVWLRILSTVTVASITVNLSNGSVEGPPVHPYSVTNVGNGWYRVTITGTPDSSTATCYANIINNTGANTYLGDETSGIYIWGAQFEAGSFATSYIPTGSATATRAADVASVSTQAFPYNASEGSLVASFQLLTGSAGSTNVVALESGVNNITLYRDASTWRYRTSLASLNITGISNVNVNKVALAYAASDYPVSTNGTAIQTNAGVGSVPAAETLQIGRGNTYGATTPINGHIRQITYIPRRLSNAELQSRSA